MKTVIAEIEKTALEYFGQYGFSDEEIARLITLGKKDLTTNLTQLESLLQQETIPVEEVNHVLHALKGLIYQLGHHALADKINESRTHLDHDTLDALALLLLHDA